MGKDHRSCSLVEVETGRRAAVDAPARQPSATACGWGPGGSALRVEDWSGATRTPREVVVWRSVGTILGGEQPWTATRRVARGGLPPHDDHSHGEQRGIPQLILLVRGAADGVHDDDGMRWRELVGLSVLTVY